MIRSAGKLARSRAPCRETARSPPPTDGTGSFFMALSLGASGSAERTACRCTLGFVRSSPLVCRSLEGSEKGSISIEPSKSPGGGVARRAHVVCARCVYVGVGPFARAEMLMVSLQVQCALVIYQDMFDVMICSRAGVTLRRCCWIASSRRQGICEQRSEATVVFLLACSLLLWVQYEPYLYILTKDVARFRRT